MSSYRDAVPIERNMDEISKRTGFRKDGKADQMSLEDKDRDYNGQLSDESFETIDTSGIVYTSKNNHMQAPKNRR